MISLSSNVNIKFFWKERNGWDSKLNFELGWTEQVWTGPTIKPSFLRIKSFSWYEALSNESYSEGLERLLCAAVYIRCNNQYHSSIKCFNKKIVFFFNYARQHNNYILHKKLFNSCYNKNVIKIISNKLLTVFHYPYSTHCVLSKI